MLASQLLILQLLPMFFEKAETTKLKENIYKIIFILFILNKTLICRPYIYNTIVIIQLALIMTDSKPNMFRSWNVLCLI